MEGEWSRYRGDHFNVRLHRWPVYLKENGHRGGQFGGRIFILQRWPV